MKLVKNICMHIAALSKIYFGDDLDKEIIENERNIKQQLKETGKPENIVLKMLDGKMKKFY